MNRKQLKPGPGWSHIGGPVYEHDSGVRIHVSGICSFGPPHFINGRAYPESVEVSRFVAINGGNRRRGVMAWGLEKLRLRGIHGLMNGYRIIDMNDGDGVEVMCAWCNCLFFVPRWAFDEEMAGDDAVPNFECAECKTDQLNDDVVASDLEQELEGDDGTDD